MNTLVIVSSVTGNTLKVAKAAHAALANSKLVLAEDFDNNLENYDSVIVAFWLDSGHADNLSLKVIEKIKNKNIALLGTLGGDPTSDPAKKVMDSLVDKVDKSNKLLGTKWIQGRISEDVLAKMYEKFTYLKTDEKHLKRVQEASTHPNEDDLKSVADCINQWFGK